MTPIRKTIEDKILEIMTILDPTGINTERYKLFFSKLSDPKFKEYITAISEGKTNIFMFFPNMKIPLKMENIFKAADKLKLPITEKIRREDPVTGLPYVPGIEYLILKLPVRRARQYLKGKYNVSEGDTHVDSLTGQVIRPDKAASLSYVETQLLHAKGLDTTLEELRTVRGGNPRAYVQFKQSIAESGEAHMNSIDTVAPSQSTQTAGVLLTSLMLEHNLDESNIM